MTLSTLRRRGTADDVVVADAFDRELFQGLLRTVPGFKAMVAGGRRRAGFDDLVRDLLLLLWQASPRLRDVTEMDGSRLEHHATISEVASLAEVRYARVVTVHDAYAAAQVCIAVAPRLHLQRAAVGVGDTMEEAASTQLAQLRAFAGWGVSRRDVTRYAHAERASLAQRLSAEALAILLDKVGRFRQTDIEQTVVGRDPLCGVELSDRLEDVAPAELALLRQGRTRAAFRQKIADGQLLTRRRGSHTGPGPLVLCLDTSGSMTHTVVDGALRVTWAKAFALAMLQASRNRRHVSVLVFGDTGEHLVKDFGTFDPGDLESLVLVMEAQFGAGTDFRSALDAAFAHVRTLRTSGQGTADIVFVTDGDCSLGAADLARVDQLKRELTTRVHGVAIGTGHDTAEWHFADKVTALRDYFKAA